MKKLACLPFLIFLLVLTACASNRETVKRSKLNFDPPSALQEKIYKDAEYAAFIQVENTTGKFWTLSGFFYYYQDQPYVLTAGHIILANETAKRILVNFKQDPTANYEAKIFKIDRQAEIAALSLPKEFVFKGNQAEFGDSAMIKAGDKIITIGSPYGTRHCLSRGVILNTKFQWIHGISFSHNAPANNGSSGGIVLNEEGEIIGMDVMASMRTIKSKAYPELPEIQISEHVVAIPSNIIKSFLEKLNP